MQTVCCSVIYVCIYNSGHCTYILFSAVVIGLIVLEFLPNWAGDIKTKEKIISPSDIEPWPHSLFTMWQVITSMKRLRYIRVHYCFLGYISMFSMNSSMDMIEDSDTHHLAMSQSQMRITQEKLSIDLCT